MLALATEEKSQMASNEEDTSSKYNNQTYSEKWSRLLYLVTYIYRFRVALCECAHININMSKQANMLMSVSDVL